MRSLIGLILTLCAMVAAADDAAEAGQKVREYFAAFSNRQIDTIVDEIYSTPVHIGGGSGHRVLASPAAAVENLENLYVTLDEQNYRESVIDNLEICQPSATLALVDTRYSRIDRAGKAIPPAVRTVLYVLQKLDGQWRIVAFYGHDNEFRPGCDQATSS